MRLVWDNILQNNEQCLAQLTCDSITHQIVQTIIFTDNIQCRKRCILHDLPISIMDTVDVETNKVHFIHSIDQLMRTKNNNQPLKSWNLPIVSVLESTNI